MRKIDSVPEYNILGKHIRDTRKKSGLTQEELGKKIGLGKTSISKIESGKTRISLEDASILMEIMGSKLNVNLMTEEQNQKLKSEIFQFSRTCVMWFSEFKGISVAEAFRLMMKNKALAFLKDNYRYERTMPKDIIVKDVDNIVKRNAILPL